MNVKLRITILIIALCCANMICLAQQSHTIGFSYDSDGNRVIREIVIPRMDNDKGETDEKPAAATDFFETTTVELYPNPTCDRFVVEIKNGGAEVSVKACLTNISGSVLCQKTIRNSLESFDISMLASGIYFLRLTAENETHVWRVIRK